MPKLSWSAFLARYPAAHLVAGVMPEGERITASARRQLSLMAKLIARLAPKGLYALTVDREHLTPEIHCVFQKDSDALKVAKAVQACSRAAGPQDRWEAVPAEYLIQRLEGLGAG
jgi:hypothetical protein